ncbi:beta/gamma crystallin domain-containing protein 1 isoform X1 [Carcharodon carcharias]|uniref:beta/gamma crystallin domain-containing protein 1 isoform X1 n=1 Tax=Carcharodon carcharias TaxID=13397 RepID=UPI001B7E3763|nr:beta/gamma crystallin domain-containing protein 1 isoform X1 [Carcharodon carcharias]
MERSERGAQPEKQQKGFKKRISRVFHRSKSSGDQEEEDPRASSKEPGSPPASQVTGSRRRSWGSWRQKKKSGEPSVPWTPPLSPPGDDISVRTSDWMLVEGDTQDSEVVYNYDHIVDIVQNAKLESQSPTSPKSPTGKSTKFQNIRFPGSGKAEEGKKKQVLDYLGDFFSSTRRKSSKNASPASLRQNNSVEECPPVTSECYSGETTIVGEAPDSGILSFSEDHRREGVVEIKAADKDLTEISQGSPEERGLLPAVGNPAELPVSSAEKNRSTSKNVIVVDVNLQHIHREAEKQTVPECTGEQLASKTVSSNPAKEFVTTVIGDVSNIFESVVVNKEDTSLSSACADASLLSDDRSVKEHEIGELDTCFINENTPQIAIKTKGSEFVTTNRLAKGQYDCETIANCVDIPAIKECVLPISETVRIEQVAEIIETDVHPPKIKEISNTTASEASVSLLINNISVELKALENTLKNEGTVQLNHSVVQGFGKETENYNIPEKLCESTLEKQQNSSKKDTFTPDTKKSQVVETGGVPRIGESVAISHDVEQFTTSNLSGENQNGVVGPESNTDKTVTNTRTDVVSCKNTAEKSSDLFSSLKTDLNSALESIEMDKKSPSESKRGKRKGRKRRSLKSNQQSDREIGNADTNTVEEELKEIASNKQSSEVPVKTASSPEQSIPLLVPHQTLPKSLPSSEKSAQDISKPITSRKKNSQQEPCSPASGDKIQSPVKCSLEKASNPETGFSGSETFTATHSSTSRSGQKVEKHIASENSDTNFVVASIGAVDDSASNKDFIFSLYCATTDELDEKMVALDSADQNNAIASVSQKCNQQNMGSSITYSQMEQESSADSGRLKTLEINDLEGESHDHHVITSQLCSTVTTRIRLPSAEKEGAFGTLIALNHQGICADIRTEEEETIRITLPTKKKATSHHQVDFFATKDLPLASTGNKKYVGSLKIQLHNKPANQAEPPATKIDKKQPSTPTHAEASGGVSDDVRHKADEILKVTIVNDGDTKHISAEEHKNKEMNITSAPVEKTPLKTFPDAQTDRPEENSSLGIAFSVLRSNTDVTDQSLSMYMHTSEISLSETDAPTKGVKEHKADLVAAASDLVLPVPLTGVGVQSREMENKTLLALNVLNFETTEPEIQKGAPTKSVNEKKMMQGEAKDEPAQPVQQNTPNVENQNIEVKDTLPQKVQTSATKVSGIKDTNVNQKGRQSAAIVEAAEQSPSKPQPRDTKDADSSESIQMPVAMPEIEKEVPAKGKQLPDSGAGKGEPAQESSPMLQVSDTEAKVYDIPVCADPATTVSEIRKSVTENVASDTVTGSNVTRGEQNKSVLENRDFEEATLLQSIETSRNTGSKMERDFSTTAAFEEKGGLENAISNFGLPALSSTPEVQRKEFELKRAVSASSVEAPAENLSRIKDSQMANSTAKHSEPGAATNEFSLFVQNIKASQLREAIVKEASLVDDTWTIKAVVDPNVDLDSSADGFSPSIEQTTSKSGEGNELNDSFNEGRSFDSSSDMESFTETIRKYGNPIHRPQKRQRVPKAPFVPPFVMPPIQEDHTSSRKEKTFDPSSFKCGLMKSNRYTSKAPSSLLKMQQIETKSKVVKRVSAEQSLLFKSLTNKSSRLRFANQENAENDHASASGSKRSRLEVDQMLTQTTKPPAEPVIEPTNLTPSLPRSDVLEQFQFDLSNPTFPKTLLPSFMESNLKSNTSEMEKKPDNLEKQSENGLTIPDLKLNLLEINTDFGGITNTCALDSTPTFQGSSTIDGNQNSLSLFNADLFTPNSVLPNLPESEIPGMRDLKLNSRPGKIAIYNQRNLCGEAIEVFHDVKDATSWKLGPEISIRVVRGCWLIYQKPNFEGDKIALEEGMLELSDIWGKEIAEDSCDDALISTPKESLIGSIRRTVKKWGLPEIDLCSELHGLGRKTTYVDDMEEIQIYGILEPVLSLEVFSGTWLLFEEPFYQGNSYIVEYGQYPCPESWGATDPFIGSLRPLKMGTLKVEKLKDNKAIVYEKPFFEGKWLELKTYVSTFVGGDEETDLCHAYPFTNVGSMKVLGGFWVGYEKPGFQGHQYVLEEGEYQEWNDWGGYDEHLQSLRLIQINLTPPLMIMYNETNFSEKSRNIEVLGPVPDLQDTDYGLRTGSINVLSGTWVAYENTNFTGEQYVLEKGLYSSYEDWGATSFKISSIQPVLLDMVDSELSTFKVQFFSEPEFQGSAQVFNMDTAQFPAGFSPKSCKVQSGSWVAYDAENFIGNQYILEEEIYSDLMMLGCANDVCIKSVKKIGFCFSIPGIILFAREKFEGKKIELDSEVRNLALQGYNSHIFSVKVNGGTWVAYECSNYKGRQILLQPCQIPNWHQHTGWHRIGSLRPVIQGRVYFRVRNRGTGAFMTFAGELNEINMIRVQALESTGLDDQIWFYQDGFIKSKMAEDCCLDVIGSFIGPNSRLGISVEDSKDIHSWNISSDGVILSWIRTDLVIDIKGGQHYDQNQTILNRFDEVQPTQRWDLEIL